MTRHSFDEAVTAVTAAGDPTALFGTRTSDGSAERKRYLALVKALHPDAVDRSNVDAANLAFTALNRLWRDYRDDTHGTVTVGGTTYRMGRTPRLDDISACYPLYDDVGNARDELRLARDPVDNDMIRAEAHALDQIAAHGDPKFAAYVPPRATTIRMRDENTGVERCGNVLPRPDTFVSLRAVARRHPDGLNPKDAAWMWRRLLVAIGHAHRSGIVHGSVIPEHVLIQPEQHGLLLIDWYYAVPAGRPLSAVVGHARDVYPAEVFARLPAEASLDILMATRCMTELIGSRIPGALERFARGCTLDDPRRRPTDAWDLLTELDEVLHRMWGPRVFRPFSMSS